MGNDLLIATLAIPTSVLDAGGANWEAARAFVLTMSADELDRVCEQWRGEPLDLTDARKEMLDLVEQVKEATSSEHRRLYATPYIVPGWTVWITGGDSWGDSPSEEFDLFSVFLDSGLAGAAGFAEKFV
jgi:hypothetical protein